MAFVDENVLLLLGVCAQKYGFTNANFHSIASYLGCRHCRLDHSSGGHGERSSTIGSHRGDDENHLDTGDDNASAAALEHVVALTSVWTHELEESRAAHAAQLAAAQARQKTAEDALLQAREAEEDAAKAFSVRIQVPCASRALSLLLPSSPCPHSPQHTTASMQTRFIIVLRLPSRGGEEVSAKRKRSGRRPRPHQERRSCTLKTRVIAPDARPRLWKNRPVS